MKVFLFPLAGYLLVQVLAARPLLPEPPLGTGSASFSGGGVAHLAGPNAVFVNPAALSIPDGFQVESGMMGFSTGLSPYFLFGSSANEKTAYSLGYYFDARVDSLLGGPARQGLIAGGSWDINPKAALGVSAHSQGYGNGIGMNGFGVDMDAGLLYRPKKLFWTGLVIHNLLEAGVGQEPAGYRTRRSYLAALGMRMHNFNIMDLRLHDPDAFYELRSVGIPPSKFSHAFSMGCAILPAGKLGFRGSLIIPHGAPPGFALSSSLVFPAGRYSMLIAYVFSAGNETDGIQNPGPMHSLSANFRLGSELDKFPPVVEVRADKLILASDSTGEVLVHFRLFASDKTLVASGVDGGNRSMKGKLLDEVESGMRGYSRQFEEGSVRDWRLMIRPVDASGKSGPTIRLFEGKDLPPRVIRWDGRDDAGKSTLPGIFAFRFSAKDLAGNESVTAWQLLDMVNAAPVDSFDLEEIP